MGERAVDGAFATIITIFLLHSQDHLEITNILLASSCFCLQSSATISEEKKEFGSGIISHFIPFCGYSQEEHVGHEKCLFVAKWPLLRFIAQRRVIRADLPRELRPRLSSHEP